MTRLLSFRVLLPVLVVALIAAAFITGGSDAQTKSLTAYFPRAVSVYVGTDVRILGVNVGRVTEIRPEGEAVAVEIEYDDEYDLPADAQAMIVTPTLVADRFIQLTPIYESGPKMADDAEIELADTGVPVELDRIYAALKDLTDTLGPNGVNANGTLDNLLSASAKALQGQGARANTTIRNLSQAAVTFGNGAGDLFETVSALADFTGTLAANDQLVNAFIADLAGVSSQLSAERGELQALLASLAGAVGVVEGFVKRNRKALVTDVEKLTRVIKNINSEKKSLDTALTVAPVAINNLVLAYNSKSGSVGSRIGVNEGRGAGPNSPVFEPNAFLCALVQQSGIPAVSRDLACTLFDALLDPAGAAALPGATRPGSPAARETATVPEAPKPTRAERVASIRKAARDAVRKAREEARNRAPYVEDTGNSLADLLGGGLL